MPLLYYWRGDNHTRDLDHGAGYHLNQATRTLHDIDIGDSLWAFTRRRDGVYVLAAELVAHAKTRNSPDYRYGPYRLWGHLQQSRYFATGEHPDITHLIRGLSVTAKGDALGRAFQGHAAVRRLTLADHAVLAHYAQHLPLEPRARLFSEERLEALLISGDPEAVDRLMIDEARGIAEERRQYLHTRALRRDARLVTVLRELYNGRCQICAWDPPHRYGAEICEGHHLRWLSRGGDDAVSNMVLLCPNHHRAVHRCDAPFDWADGAFVFGDQREGLLERRHLLLAG
jgi:5-methylcytosine-specific restriction protein A